MQVLKNVFITCLFCTLLVLTSCNGSEKNPGELLDPENPVSITVWHYYNGPQKIAFDKLVSEFNETVGFSKGIIVEAYSQGGIAQLNQKVLDAAEKKVGADVMPDIFAAYADDALKLSRLGVIAKLDTYLTQKEIAEYVPAYIEEGRFDGTGELKIFPVAKTTEVLMVNATDWDRFANATGAKVEQLGTWEGIADLARQYYEWTDSLTPEKGNGKAFFGRDAFANYMLVGTKQLGHEIVRVENEQAILDVNKEVIKRLWDNYYIPYIKGYFAANGRFRSDDIKMGDIIAMVGATTGAVYFPTEVTISDKETYPITLRTYPLPGFSGMQPHAVQQGAGMLVTKSSPSKEYAAVEFLKWFTEATRNISFSASSGYLPVKTAANDIQIIRDTMEKTGYTALNPSLQEALDIASWQVHKYTMYTTKACVSTAPIRSILERAIPERARTDRAKVSARVKQGMSPDEATADFVTDRYFEQWYAEFQNSLNKAIQ